MKVYIVEFRYYDDCFLVGLFTSKEIAEKYIIQSIHQCYGKKADISKYRSRYSISIEDVIGE